MNDVVSDTSIPSRWEEEINGTQELWPNLSSAEDFDLNMLSFEMFDFVADPGLDFQIPVEGQFQESFDPFPVQLPKATPSPEGTSKSLVGILPGSPIHLLNSSFTANMMSEHLSKIFDTMMTFNSSIFLGYGANDFEGRYPYRFEDEDTILRYQ